MLFDTHVIVDWSAANQPKTGRDSIWICRLGAEGESVCNPPTRHAAKGVLADMLASASGRAERVLLGFDFPFGYPAGFAARLGLVGTPWRTLWDEIAGLLHDNENNRNDRFEVGAMLNRRVSNGSGRFPFWGCPVGFTHEFLGPRHHRGHTSAEPLKERRLIDEWMVGAQPCWKLAYTGSVGSQSLTGIPVVRGLRDDPRWENCARIWPFETGLAPSRRRTNRLRRGLAVMVAQRDQARPWPAQRQSPSPHRRRDIRRARPRRRIGGVVRRRAQSDQRRAAGH